MSSFFDQLEEQLAAAARVATDTQDGARARWIPTTMRTRRWKRPVGLVIPALGTVMVALLVAILAVVLIHRAPHVTADRHGVWTAPPHSSGPVQLFPNGPSPSQQQDLGYINQALEPMFKRRQCLTGMVKNVNDSPSYRPSFAQGGPGAATLDALAVLRRPAAASDALPPRVLGSKPNQQVWRYGTYPAVHGIYARYIREARHRFGANYYVIPAANINTQRRLSAHCYAEIAAALARERTHVPGTLRSSFTALARRYVAVQRHNELPYAGVCLIAINDTGNGGGGCNGGSLSQIENGTTSMPSAAPSGVGVVFGLVPDQVRTVTFEYHSHPPVTVRAISNVIIVRRRGLPNYGFPDTTIWRDASGHIIKTIHRP